MNIDALIVAVKEQIRREKMVNDERKESILWVLNNPHYANKKMINSECKVFKEYLKKCCLINDKQETLDRLIQEKYDKYTVTSNEFKSLDEVEPGRDMLCLVSSYDEKSYWLVAQKKTKGKIYKEDCIVDSYTGEALENTKILQWEYLPDMSSKGDD